MSDDGKQSRDQIKIRMETAKYILDVSYKLITHYDSKCGHLTILIGFDFTILAVLIAFLFDKLSTISLTIRVILIMAYIINFTLIIISLYFIRTAMIPHTNPIEKIMKPKPGLIYFMDIKKNLGEDEYVEILLGKKATTTSKFFTDIDSNAFEKTIIEDCARDVYAHAEILQVKVKNVKMAFNMATIASSTCVLTVLIISLLYVLGV
jgi:hypothetical protein